MRSDKCRYRRGYVWHLFMPTFYGRRGLRNLEHRLELANKQIYDDWEVKQLYGGKQ